MGIESIARFVNANRLNRAFLHFILTVFEVVIFEEEVFEEEFDVLLMICKTLRDGSHIIQLECGELKGTVKRTVVRMSGPISL